jgi:hypothetical protein
MYWFHIILRMNSDYSLKQLQQNYVYNGNGLCFLWGMNWILKYHADELRLQKINAIMTYYGTQAFTKLLILFGFSHGMCLWLERLAKGDSKSRRNNYALLRICLFHQCSKQAETIVHSSKNACQLGSLRYACVCHLQQSFKEIYACSTLYYSSEIGVWSTPRDVWGLGELPGDILKNNEAY